MPTAPNESETWLPAAFEEHRRAVHAHCYRLTGSVADADDLVQECFLRAWRARHRFEGRASARTWLYRIATNAYLDTRKAASRRSIPAGDPLEWSTRLGPYPDALLGDDPQRVLVGRETVELALIAALMYLAPRQRAAFVLRDLSGWTAAETAEALGVAVPAANSLVQRARQTLRRHVPDNPLHWRRPQLTVEDEQLLRRYADANDPDTLRALLADDVRITMPPDAPVVGVDAVVEFLSRPLDWRTVASAANGRPALLSYLRRPGQPHHEPWVVDVLRIEQGKIAEINAFVGVHHVAAFAGGSRLDAD